MPDSVNEYLNAKWGWGGGPYVRCLRPLRYNWLCRSKTPQNDKQRPSKIDALRM